MQVVWVTRWDELAGLAPYWNALARGVPFRSWAWLGGWWRYYGHAQVNGPRRLFALAVYDERQELVGLAPWYLETTRRWGEVVRFLGSGDVCSDYLSILSLPGHEDAVAVALADWLCGDAHVSGGNVWNALLLGGVDADDAVTRCFVARMEEYGSLVYAQPGPNCWRIDLPATWDDYLAGLSKSHRKQVRRLERRLFGAGQATLRTVDEQADLDRGLEILADLHARRRGALGQRALFDDADFAGFHREVAKQLLADRVLRLAWVELDGRPVAAEYQVAGSHAVYAYQSGIDPAALNFEPGRLAMMATLRLVIEDGFRSFDLLRGDEPYKAHWRARPRPSVQFNILPGRGADWLKDRAWIAGWQMSYWLRAGWKRVASLAQAN
ncbi:MAG TPA: GNAT family N-acetyltransferase [Pirellulales bacterium]|nr:GNAT family N-acetyltransferase [Pirellulales bacterium]